MTFMILFKSFFSCTFLYVGLYSNVFYCCDRLCFISFIGMLFLTFKKSPAWTLNGPLLWWLNIYLQQLTDMGWRGWGCFVKYNCVRKLPLIQLPPLWLWLNSIIACSLKKYASSLLHCLKIWEVSCVFWCLE